jgi:hypothetical protein
MNENSRSYITAIGDSNCEGFISGSLHRQGREVIYRALSPTHLLQFLQEGTAEELAKITIVMSSDFFHLWQGINAGFHLDIEIVMLQSRPTTDFEVMQLLLPAPTVEIKRSPSLGDRTQAIGIGSIGSRVGTSTFALNFGQELALTGISTLVVDANPRSHFLTEHFGIFGLNRGVHRFSNNLSLLEVGSSHEIESWISEFTHFDFVIVDLGEIHDFQDTLLGRRKGDGVLRWIAHHGKEIIVISDEEIIQRSEAIEKWRRLLSTAMNPRTSLMINNIGSAGRAERARRNLDMEKLLSSKIDYFPRDNRSIAAMKSQRSTLAISAPKSRLRHEIMEYALKGHSPGE